MFSAENKLKISILISGTGSNMQAIAENVQQKKLPNVQINHIISDQPKALGLSKARNMGLKAVYLDPGPYKTKFIEEKQQEYADFLLQNNNDLICLAGFMRLLKKPLIDAFPRKIINIHPSLLPKYPGLDTHKRALAAGDREAGCSIHFVDSGMDTGEIIDRRKVDIAPDETEATLKQKVLRQEHILYSQVIKKISENKIKIGV
ncbi:MAG TPA: phosphoribosylglycinamide formyltransferase [Spirochaetota bacterium]|nr:phosphoribosylglycinamide formyltransferase [Spirochaetota bacterium]